MEEGAKVKAYDPIAEENFKKIFGTKIKYTKTAQEALKDAEVCFIFTEWDEIKIIKPIEYKELMKTPLVYDGRNIYKLNEMSENSVEYYSIGR
mgnify:FL=1